MGRVIFVKTWTPIKGMVEEWSHLPRNDVALCPKALA